MTSIAEMSVSAIAEREFTIDDTNEDMWAAQDRMRAEKERIASKMGMEVQRRMHANNPIQLKMIDNQVQLQEQNNRRMNSKYDSKISEINRILEEKKVRDQALLEKGLEEVQTDVANLKIETSSLAGQINLLKQEAAARKKEFDSAIGQVRDKFAKQDEWNEEVYSQVYALQADSALLMAEYEEKQKDLREKQYIEADPNTKVFYETVFSKMNEVFVATKALNSGMISRAQYADGDKAASFINLAGSLIPLPAVTTVLSYVAKGVQYLSDKREADRIQNISGSALGFSEMDEQRRTHSKFKICDWISRGLVFAYEEQIRALTTDSAATFGECCVKYVLDFLARSEDEKDAAASALAEASAAAAAATLAANSGPGGIPRPNDAATPRGSVSLRGIDSPAPSVTAGTTASLSAGPAQEVAVSPRDQLVTDLLIYMSNRRGIKNGKWGLNDVSLTTRIPGLTFTDRGIIKQCGLRTISGTMYHAPPPVPVNKEELAKKLVEKEIVAVVDKELGITTPPPSAPGQPQSPPAMSRTKSFGSKLFKWGSTSSAKQIVSDVSGAKEKAGGIALDLSLRLKEVAGTVLSDDTCRPEIYGYRLGTQREAAVLGMYETSQRAFGRIVPLSPDQLARDPKAQSKFWTGK
ncbi:hypothetical protein HDU79_008928 [Rhizoclosmatium sp. JEL0117]|nr:hypothetical protein HDU79_008928 [Rhizoclosmatium sp. JEL0117]